MLNLVWTNVQALHVGASAGRVSNCRWGGAAMSAADGDSVPQLKVTRAPEVDDLRWENLDLTIRIKGEEWPRLSHPLALMRRNAAVLVAVFLLWTSFNIILRLTADKIELKETQTISMDPAQDPCKHCLPTDDFLGHGLEIALQKVLLYFGFDVYGENRLSAALPLGSQPLMHSCQPIDFVQRADQRFAEFCADGGCCSDVAAGFGADVPPALDPYC